MIKSKKCLECGKEFIPKCNRYILCGRSCSGKMGGRRRKELYPNQCGENNPNWKGGISKNNYHYKKIQKQRYPEKIRAREIVRRAIKNGKINREPCEVCGEKISHAHHEDYTKPLEVMWLCMKHHRELHVKKP